MNSLGYNNSSIKYIILTKRFDAPLYQTDPNLFVLVYFQFLSKEKSFYLFTIFVLYYFRLFCKIVRLLDFFLNFSIIFNVCSSICEILLKLCSEYYSDNLFLLTSCRADFFSWFRVTLKHLAPVDCEFFLTIKFKKVSKTISIQWQIL